jgi:hypothetical protein
VANPSSDDYKPISITKILLAIDKASGRASAACAVDDRRKRGLRIEIGKRIELEKSDRAFVPTYG